MISCPSSPAPGNCNHLFAKPWHKNSKGSFYEHFSPSVRPSSFPEERWTTAFNHVSQQIRQYFARPKSHQHALAYLQGLMSQVSRKNGWQVAEEMGEATPYAMQHLLDRARWDCDRVRDELRA
jgi:hypothetical protein